MAWSYSGNPSTTPKDTVRYLTGDTDNARQLASDEEIGWALEDQNGDVYKAGASVLEALASRYALKADKTVAGLSINYGTLAERLAARAKDLLQQGRRRKPGAVVLTQSDESHQHFVMDGMDIDSPATNPFGWADDELLGG